MQHLDPRWRGFRSRTPVADVLALIDRRIGPLEAEESPLATAAGRVLAEEVRATSPVPPFDRAAMDGYAVRGEETFGADPYTPALFRVVGRSRPGKRFAGKVEPGQAVEIATGAPLPLGANAVVPVEVTNLEGDVVRVVEPTPPARHVGRRGEDLSPGADVLPAGRVLRAQDLGLLSALGRAMIPVLRRPTVAVVITGDELLPPGMPAHDDQIASTSSRAAASGDPSRASS